MIICQCKNFCLLKKSNGKNCIYYDIDQYYNIILCTGLSFEYVDLYVLYMLTLKMYDFNFIKCTHDS